MPTTHTPCHTCPARPEPPHGAPRRRLDRTCRLRRRGRPGVRRASPAGGDGVLPARLGRDAVEHDVGARREWPPSPLARPAASLVVGDLHQQRAAVRLNRSAENLAVSGPGPTSVGWAAACAACASTTQHRAHAPDGGYGQVLTIELRTDRSNGLSFNHHRRRQPARGAWWGRRRCRVSGRDALSGVRGAGTDERPWRQRRAPARSGATAALAATCASPTPLRSAASS